MHKNWRDCMAWKSAGLPVQTSSNEACKLYDATLTQYVGWYDDPSVGGIEASCEKMLSADPNFVMGHVLVNGLDIMGTGRSPVLDSEFKRSLDNLVAMAKKQDGTLTERERKHVRAVDLCGQGFMSDACLVWADILLDHPTDMLALKFAHDAYFYLGYQPQMRDSIARVLPHWKQDMPLYGYLFGMHSFGLVETNFYKEAETVARKGLDLNRGDPWSTHSMAHALEMMGRQNDGIAFMSSTVADWEPRGMLACHNFWHWAVYHIDKGEHQAALDIFDGEISKRCNTSGAMLDIVDATSMLYRLEMEGINIGSRWGDIYEACLPHKDDHLMAFNDVHVLMSCLGAKQKETTAAMMESIQNFVRSGRGTNHSVTKEVGGAICEAFVAYDDGDFAKATDLLSPLKYQVLHIGGSNAQRDLFSQFLIHSAMKSTKPEHHKLARHLLTERKAMKENSPLTDRLIAKTMAQHVD